MALRRPPPAPGRLREGVRGLSVRVRVRLAPVLASLAGGESKVDLDLADTATVGDVLATLATRHPAVGRRVRDEQDAVRRHVNVFVGPDNIRDLTGQDTPVTDGVEVTILPAISGGTDAFLASWATLWVPPRGQERRQ